MIFNGTKSSTTPGTRVRLAAVHTPACWMTVVPRRNNDGTPANMSPVVIGGNDVAFTNGYVLQSGDAAVAWPVSEINWLDLYEVWMDVITSGDGVQFIYATR